MKSIEHHPLTGCRVPVLVDNRDSKCSNAAWCIWTEWQHGTHIDSLPIEAPIEPIQGPRLDLRAMHCE